MGITPEKKAQVGGVMLTILLYLTRNTKCIHFVVRICFLCIDYLYIDYVHLNVRDPCVSMISLSALARFLSPSEKMCNHIRQSSHIHIHQQNSLHKMSIHIHRPNSLHKISIHIHRPNSLHKISIHIHRPNSLHKISIHIHQPNSRHKIKKITAQD